MSDLGSNGVGAKRALDPRVTIDPKALQQVAKHLQALYPKMAVAFAEMRRYVEEILAPAIAESIRQASAALATIGPHLERQLPRNWWGIGGFTPQQVEKLVLTEGLPLAWIPSTRVLRLILDARSPGERRAILSRNRAGILTECRRHLEPLRDRDELAAFALEAIDAMRAGYFAAAQALAISVLDSAGSRFEKWHTRTAKNQRPKTSTMPLRDALVWGAVWAAYGNYHPSDSPPRALSRHATSHGVSRRQYSQINALLAVMQATSFLKLSDQPDVSSALRSARRR